MRRLVVCLFTLILASCQAKPEITIRQSIAPPAVWEPDKAIVIVAVDIREKTSLRDNIPHFGSVFFRKVDGTYSDRPRMSFDFGIQYSKDADWGAIFGKVDENRVPHVFSVEPGMYVIERIEVAGQHTNRPGYYPKENGVSYGAFSVNAGDVVNLGRIVVHMHWYQGHFTQRVEDNGQDVESLLKTRYPFLSSRLHTRLLTVTEFVPYGRYW